jgi:hypothetical protein
VNWSYIGIAIYTWDSGELTEKAITHLYQNSGYIIIQSLGLYTEIREILRRYYLHINDNKANSVFEIVSVTRNWDSTNERDKVFALLGFPEI